MIEDIYNEIQPDSKKKLNQHLRECEYCRTEFKELNDANNTLKLWKVQQNI